MYCRASATLSIRSSCLMVVISLVVRVFTRATADLVGRVLRTIDRQLIANRRGKVDVHLVGETDQVHQHVRHLMPHMLALRLRELGTGAGLQPLERLEQLGRLDTERSRQVLG